MSRICSQCNKTHLAAEFCPYCGAKVGISREFVPQLQPPYQLTVLDDTIIIKAKLKTTASDPYQSGMGFFGMMSLMFSGDVFTGDDIADWVEVTNTGVKVTKRTNLSEARLLVVDPHTDLEDLSDAPNFPGAIIILAQKGMDFWFDLATNYRQANVEKPLRAALNYMVSNGMIEYPPNWTR